MSLNFCLPCGSNCCKTENGGSSSSMTNGAGRPHPGKKHSQSHSHSFTPVDIFKPILVDSPALMRLPPRRASPEGSLNSVDTLKNSELIDPGTISKSSYSISSLYAYDINDEEVLKPLLRSRTESEIYMGDEFTLASYPSSPQCIWVPVTCAMPVVAQEDLGKSLDFLQLKLKHIDSSRESSEISSVKNYRNGPRRPIVVSSLEQTKMEPTYKTSFNIDIIPKNSPNAASTKKPNSATRTFPRYKGMQSREDYKCFINILPPARESLKEEIKPNELKNESLPVPNTNTNNTLTIEPIQSPSGSDYFSNTPSPNSVLSNEIRMIPAENEKNSENFGDQVATLTRDFQNQLNESDSMPIPMPLPLREPESVRAKLVVNQNSKLIHQPEPPEFAIGDNYGQIHQNSMPFGWGKAKVKNEEDIELKDVSKSAPPIASTSQVPGPGPRVRKLLSTEEIREIVNGTGRGRSRNYTDNGLLYPKSAQETFINAPPVISSKRFHVQLVEDFHGDGEKEQQPKLRRNSGKDQLPEVPKPGASALSIPHHRPFEPFVDLDYSLRRSGGTGREREHIYEVCKEPPYVPTPVPVEKQVKLPAEIHELSANVGRLEENLQGSKDRSFDLSSLARLIESEEFQQVLPLYNQIEDRLCLQPPPAPVCTNLHQVVQECIPTLYNTSSNLLPESYELINLLNKPMFEQQIHCHDILAKRMELTMETPDNLGAPADDLTLNPEPEVKPKRSIPEHRFRNVQIEKTNEPLGVTILNEGNKILIARIITGGTVGSSGLLRVGDEIIEINGVQMTGKSINEVYEALRTMSGILTFRIAPAKPTGERIFKKNAPIPIRAMFDYDPSEDLFLPCRELGIGFIKNDILYVINQDDANWWQAYREGEEDTLAGLIPSKSFQEHREILRRKTIQAKMAAASGSAAASTSGSNQTRQMSSSSTLLTYTKGGVKSSKKKKITRSSTTANFDTEIFPEDIPTYEEVILYYPCSSFRRPIVLVGPSNVGRHELRQMLFDMNPAKFTAAVAHTSRPPKPGDVNGRDYHFVSRSEFEAAMMDRSFIEYGEYESQYYGTTFDSLQAVIDADKYAVMNLHPRSITGIRTAGFKPYVVFVTPPPFYKFKQMKLLTGQTWKDDELKDTIRKAVHMEEKFGHLFDSVIVITDLQRAFKDLVFRINSIERNPQWVPAAWLGGRNRINSAP